MFSYLQNLCLPVVLAHSPWSSSPTFWTYRPSVGNGCPRNSLGGNLSSTPSLSWLSGRGGSQGSGSDLASMATQPTRPQSNVLTLIPLFCPLHTSPFFLPHLCPGCSPSLGCPPHSSHPVQGKQHRVMEKRAGPASRQAATDGNLTWPLPSSGTWSTYLNLPVNRNGNTSLPGFL